MCQERTLCMYSPCQELTSNQERRTRCLLLVLVSDLYSSSLKTQELTIKLWGQPESTLGIEIISRIILNMNESPLLVKTSHIPVCTSHAKCWPFKYWWFALSSKVCNKIQVRSWWRLCVCVYVYVCVCVCVCVCVYTFCILFTLFVCVSRLRAWLTRLSVWIILGFGPYRYLDWLIICLAA